MEALAAEGVPCSTGYGQPLYRNPIFLEKNFRGRGCPASCGHYSGTVDYREVSCPMTEMLCEQVIWLFHNLLLGTEQDIDDIYRAFEKVTSQHRQLL